MSKAPTQMPSFLEPTKDEELHQKLDKIIELLSVNNALLYRALGGETDEVIVCPKCNKEIKPDKLGYCQYCKTDLVKEGLVDPPQGVRKERK